MGTIIRNSGYGANMRYLPAGALVRELPDGTQVTALATGTVNAIYGGLGYTWQAIRLTDNELGWVAAKFLADDTPPPPPTPTAKSLVGLHVLQDGKNAVEQFLAKLPPATRLASATVLNAPDIAALLAPRTDYLICRNTPTEHDPIQFALDLSWVDALPAGAYAQVANEVKWTPAHNQNWLDVMQALEAKGRKAAICAYAIGQPEPAEWQALTQALEYAKTHGHLVVLHAYCAPNTPVGQLSTDGADYELRFIRLYNSVPETARPTLVISEFAHAFIRGTFEGTEALLKTADLYQAAIKPFPYVGGFNQYTVGKLGGWETSCIDSALPELATYVETGHL